MPADQIASNLALINWTVLASLAVGSFTVVALARLRTDATKGYMAFTAFCAAAFATHQNWQTFLVGLAASIGAGISMGFA